MSEGSTTLFVGRISEQTKANELEELFGRHGKILRCFVKEKGNQSYAFVTFEDASSATRAYDELQGSTIGGNKINIERARAGNRRENGVSRGGPSAPSNHSSYCGAPAHSYSNSDRYHGPPSSQAQYDSRYGPPASRVSSYSAQPPYPSSSSRRSRERSPPRTAYSSDYSALSVSASLPISASSPPPGSSYPSRGYQDCGAPPNYTQPQYHAAAYSASYQYQYPYAPPVNVYTSNAPYTSQTQVQPPSSVSSLHRSRSPYRRSSRSPPRESSRGNGGRSPMRRDDRERR